MTVSHSSELKQKLILLRQQKTKEILRYCWRSLFVSSIAGSLLWGATLPQWQIQHKKQVQIQGNPLDTQDTIYALLALSYPQYIWAIPTKKLSSNLESIPPIINAKVTRQILPARLNISLQERIPVALALSSGKVGFLDAQGMWIPPHFYNQLDQNFAIPTLKVTNFQPHYRSTWIEIYRLIKRYHSIEIFEVQWRESNDLVLKTELGTVYFGSPTSRLEDKFIALARLKNLPNYIQRSRIAYIDLRNPDIRLIEKYPIESKTSP